MEIYDMSPIVFLIMAIFGIMEHYHKYNINCIFIIVFFIMYELFFRGQTWENPLHIDKDTGCKGDNDPIDAIDIGGRV
jgi:hypothetical protein